MMWILICLLPIVLASNVTRSLPESRGLVVNGRDADEDRYPYFALVVSMDRPESGVCGGVLIHDDLVLSSAHCIQIAQPKMDLESISDDDIMRNVRVFVNPNSRRDASDRIEEGLAVTAVSIHPKFGGFNDKIHRTENDLMVLRIETPSARGDGPPIVSMNTDPTLPSDGQSVFVLGFGIQDANSRSVPKVLQEAELQVVPSVICENFYTKIHEASDDICAQGTDGRNACYGDSGGPLLLKGTPDVLIGIVAHGPEEVEDGNYTDFCGDPVWPAVYVRVSTYKNWLDAAICDLSTSPPLSCSETDVPDTMLPTKAPTSNPTDSFVEPHAGTVIGDTVSSSVFPSEVLLLVLLLVGMLLGGAM